MGLIWIGTGDGLNLYDGHEIKQKFKHNPVQAIKEDLKTGNLYLSTKIGLAIYLRHNDKVKLLKNYIPTMKDIFSQRASTFILTKNSEIIMSNLATLYIIDSTQTHYKVYNMVQNEADENRISYLYECADGNLLVGCLKGLYLFDRKTKKFITIENGQNIFRIEKIYVDSSHNLWICTNNDGLYLFENGNLNNKPQYFSNENGYMLNKKTRDIVEFEKHKYYIINRNEGLVYWDRASNIRKNYIFDKHNPFGLPSKALTKIFKDSQGNIWLGTFKNGLCFLDNYKKKFQHFRMNFKDDGLINNNVNPMFQDSEGYIWIGTDNGGGLSKFDRKRGTFVNYYPDYNNPDGLHDEYILCIEKLDKDRLLLGTLKKGIEIFNKKTGKFSHYPINDKKKREISIFCMKKDLNGNIWAAGGIDFFKFNPSSGVFEKIDKIHRIESIAQTHKDSLWLASFNQSLIRININDYKYTTYPSKNIDSIQPNRISSNMLRVVRTDSQGNLWIGTEGYGFSIKKKNSNKFENFNTSNGLVHDQISDILFENDSIVWISTSNGLSRFDYAKKTFRNYDIHDGLQGNEFGMLSSLKTKNGELYFGGRNGFNVFNPNEIKDNPIIPKLIFTDFRLFNKSVSIDTINSPLKKNISITNSLTISHEQSVITFTYVALNYSSPKKNQYAYKLEGFDKEWNYVNNKKEATYTNLPPGNYTFKVIGSNNDGKWNTHGISLDLNILPPWWETWWFRSISFIVIVGSMLLYYLFRMSAMKNRQKFLEQKVEERTKDLQEANIILVESKEEINQQKKELELKQNSLISRNKEVEAKNIEIEIKNTILEEQKSNLKEKNNKLTEAYMLLAESNRKIKSSINYAKTIQNAILPTKTSIESIFDYFAIYKPKDVVSGDFYWINKIEENTYILAVIDCTGHGVPGAFMSMIGNRLLNSIVFEKKIYSPKDILMQMHLEVQKVLHQNSSKNDDGMDICLCKIENTENPLLTFSGAKRPLYLYNSLKQEISQYKGGLNSIGGNYFMKKFPFYNSEIKINKGDCIYLTSDGYIDQNNNIRRSFGSLQLLKLLGQIAKHSTDVQKQILEKELENYMGNEKQRDDITIIGIKL